MNAERFLGIPYKLGGRSFAGCDCVGIIDLFFRETMGRPMPVDNGLLFESEWKKQKDYIERYDKAVRESAARIDGAKIFFEFERIKPGDILVFECNGKIGFLSVYIGENRMLNSDERIGQSYITKIRKGWRDRFSFAIRVE